jgi:hypothetical protein
MDAEDETLRRGGPLPVHATPKPIAASEIASTASTAIRCLIVMARSSAMQTTRRNERAL